MESTFSISNNDITNHKKQTTSKKKTLILMDKFKLSDEKSQIELVDNQIECYYPHKK